MQFTPLDPRYRARVPYSPATAAALLRDTASGRGHRRWEKDAYNKEQQMTPVWIAESEHLLWGGGTEACFSERILHENKIKFRMCVSGVCCEIE